MRNRWLGIAEECCAALVRASYSTNIKDRRDCSVALATPDGVIVAQAEVGTPLHLGIMPGVLGAILAEFPPDSMQPGDMYASNLPYPEGPGHLPDLSLVAPIFHRGELVALSASTAHHVDMGGYAPGSMPFGVTEIYQEGLQIPPIALVRGGELQEPILRLIEQNVRTRIEVRGDLMAQYATARTAERRVAELLDAGDGRLALDAIPAILDHAEACMRAGIRGPARRGLPVRGLSGRRRLYRRSGTHRRRDPGGRRRADRRLRRHQRAGGRSPERAPERRARRRLLYLQGGHRPRPAHLGRRLPPDSRDRPGRDRHERHLPGSDRQRQHPHRPARGRRAAGRAGAVRPGAGPAPPARAR